MIERLKSQKDFQLIFKDGKRIREEILTIYYRKRSENTLNRLAVSVSSKVGKAVYRNKIKRWTRESIKYIEKSFNKKFHGYDILVSIRNKDVKYNFNDIKNSLLKSLGSANII
jgi:ribonuclease P protein component